MHKGVLCTQTNSGTADTLSFGSNFPPNTNASIFNLELISKALQTTLKQVCEWSPRKTYLLLEG